MQQIECSSPPLRSSWSTDDTRPDEQFTYYREAICQAFMKLTPEPPTAARFAATVENFRMG